MIDIALIEKNGGGYTFGIENGDFEKCVNYDTALTLDHICERRADSTQIGEPKRRRGWIGNLSETINGRQLGSSLWTLSQSRLNSDTRNKAVAICEQAFEHYLEDGQATEVDVSGEIIPTKGISLLIKITPVGGDAEKKYINLWELTGVE